MSELDLDNLEGVAFRAKLDMDENQSKALWTHRVTFDPPTALVMIARIRELETKLAASDKLIEKLSCWSSVAGYNRVAGVAPDTFASGVADAQKQVSGIILRSLDSEESEQ